LQLKVQDEKMATEWPGRTPKDGEIDLNGPINDAERLIRATTRPYPGAFIVIDEKKYVIWKARLVKEKSKHLCLDFKDGFLECLEWETW
jgi:methionyl-tRNA formyltransferase